jgi:hypothetical protein
LSARIFYFYYFFDIKRLLVGKGAAFEKIDMEDLIYIRTDAGIFT